MVYDDGRYRIHVACDMQFQDFPFDVQKCNLDFYLGKSIYSCTSSYLAVDVDISGCDLKKIEVGL